MADDYLVRCEIRSVCISCDSPFGKIDISDLISLKHDKRTGKFRIGWRPEILGDENFAEGETFNEAFLKFVVQRLLEK